MMYSTCTCSCVSCFIFKVLVKFALFSAWRGEEWCLKEYNFKKMFNMHFLNGSCCCS